MIEVVHADEHVVVVDKPAGLPSVPGRSAELKDCASSRVLERHADALVVHRLDQPTSGLLAFARGAQAQRELARAFARHEVDKRYVAVVDGLVTDDEGRIDAPIGADWSQRPKRRIDPDHGRPALTHWRVLERDPTARRTRLELRPVTGRTHQLRVHCASIGHAIAGDALYGRVETPTRLLLHAQSLAFVHPGRGERVTFCSDAPF